MKPILLGLLLALSLLRAAEAHPEDPAAQAYAGNDVAIASLRVLGPHDSTVGWLSVYFHEEGAGGGTDGQGAGPWFEVSVEGIEGYHIFRGSLDPAAITIDPASGGTVSVQLGRWEQQRSPSRPSEMLNH